MALSGPSSGAGGTASAAEPPPVAWPGFEDRPEPRRTVVRALAQLEFCGILASVGGLILVVAGAVSQSWVLGPSPSENVDHLVALKALTWGLFAAVPLALLGASLRPRWRYLAPWGALVFLPLSLELVLGALWWFDWTSTASYLSPGGSASDLGYGLMALGLILAWTGSLLIVAAWLGRGFMGRGRTSREVASQPTP